MVELSPKYVLDSKKSILLIIDVQKALFTRPNPIYKASELIHNINSLIEMYKEAGGLMVYIQHSNNKLLIEGTDGWKFHPDLKTGETDIVVHKLHGNAFENTGLDQILKSRGIDTVVATGLVTHGCVRATCMGAHDLGYRVILIKDGHSNFNKDAEKVIQEWNQKLSKEFVELVSSGEIQLQE